jgi:protein-S-isoprenylcysteine O-methyltransferase Ste14
LGALVFGLLLNRRFPIAFLPRKITRILGWPLLSGGVLLICWFEWAMRHAGTPANPYKPVSHIATEGPFRYTRNPAYLAMTMIYTGIASLVNALWATLMLPVALLVIQRGVIRSVIQVIPCPPDCRYEILTSRAIWLPDSPAHSRNC